MNKKELKKQLKPFGNVIQVCPRCGKIDVSIGHEEKCDPAYQQYLMESREQYWKD